MEENNKLIDMRIKWDATLKMAYLVGFFRYDILDI